MPLDPHSLIGDMHPADDPLRTTDNVPADAAKVTDVNPPTEIDNSGSRDWQQ
jgi:hypothetical protein